MTIESIGFKSYASAMAEFTRSQKNFENVNSAVPVTPKVENSFADTLNSSLQNVNGMQRQKTAMIESFASGETQNVHELMITLQKAGLAVNMTSAVRNKVLEAYKELTRLQF